MRPKSKHFSLLQIGPEPVRACCRGVKNPTPALANAAAEQSDAIQAKAATAAKAEGQTYDDKGELRAATVDNIDARAQRDTAVAEAEVSQAVARAEVVRPTDEYGDADTPDRPKSIEAAPLVKAGMLAPEGVALAAATPAPESVPEPAPEQQRPRVATPSQGMGA